MLLVSYDISDDKVRNRFSKFLSKFGYRLQYSVFELKNSTRILENVVITIESQFNAHFTESDSVIIFHLSKQCKKYMFGFQKHADDDLIIINRR